MDFNPSTMVRVFTYGPYVGSKYTHPLKLHTQVLEVNTSQSKALVMTINLRQESVIPLHPSRTSAVKHGRSQTFDSRNNNLISIIA